jgi:hypothetical protein
MQYLNHDRYVTAIPGATAPEHSIYKEYFNASYSHSH